MDSLDVEKQLVLLVGLKIAKWAVEESSMSSCLHAYSVREDCLSEEDRDRLRRKRQMRSEQRNDERKIEVRFSKVCKRQIMRATAKCRQMVPAVSGDKNLWSHKPHGRRRHSSY